MAEERTLGLARAVDADDDEDLTKAELQRRMEEARESITQTVSEIKDTVTTQYHHVRDSVNEALDWREQYRKRPLAWSVGALGAGVVVGYVVGGIFDRRGSDDYYAAYDDEATSLRPAAPARAYAAQAITGGSYGSSEYAAPPQSDFQFQGGGPTGGGYQAAPTDAAEEEPEQPGLIERFKGTRAYDRLEEEVSSLGDRFLDELSTAARTVVLPALFSKVKEMFGVDLGNKAQGQSSARPEQRASASAAGDQGGGAAYATSENASYGASSSAGTE